MPTAIKNSNFLEKFHKVYFQYSEQHADCRPARVEHDTKDCRTVAEWLDKHNPFPSHQALFSITIRMMAKEDANVNCHIDYIRDKGTMRKMIGEAYKKTIKCTKKTITLASSVRALKNTEPLPLFQRMYLSQHRSNIAVLHDFPCYELSPWLVVSCGRDFNFLKKVH